MEKLLGRTTMSSRKGRSSCVQLPVHGHKVALRNDRLAPCRGCPRPQGNHAREMLSQSPAAVLEQSGALSSLGRVAKGAWKATTELNSLPMLSPNPSQCRLLRRLGGPTPQCAQEGGSTSVFGSETLWFLGGEDFSKGEVL